MVFKATSNNISVILWWSVLLVEKTTNLPQVTDKLYHIMPERSQDTELFIWVKFMGNYQKFQVVSFVHDLTGNISAKFNLIHSL
jgi:hypothetical protein